MAFLNLGSAGGSTQITLGKGFSSLLYVSLEIVEGTPPRASTFLPAVTFFEAGCRLCQNLADVISRLFLSFRLEL